MEQLSGVICPWRGRRGDRKRAHEVLHVEPVSATDPSALLSSAIRSTPGRLLPSSPGLRWRTSPTMIVVDRPMATSPSRRPLRLLRIAALLAIAAIAACARNPPVGSVSVRPIPPGEARVWFYRVYLPSDTLNMTKVTMNGVFAGYAQLGGAFYRDVPPGNYHVEVESYGKDFDQSTNVALVPGQDAYVKIESLDSWSTFVGAGYAAARDTFYARLMLPQIARSEIVQSFFDGGS